MPRRVRQRASRLNYFNLRILLVLWSDKIGWSKWDLWSACSVSCGVGTRTRTRRCEDGYGKPKDTCRGPSSRSRKCLAPCKNEVDIEKLMKKAAPEEMKYLRRIAKKLANKKVKEEIFSGKEAEDWVIVGYETGNATVDRPLTCARLCMLSVGCRSFNYQHLTTNGENDLSVPKICVLNSVAKDEVDKSALQVKEGYRLFVLEPFFE